MKLDAALPFGIDLGDVPAAAAAAERIGFDALWTAETVRDPFLPLAVVAERTRRLRFGTAVAVAFARSPLATAHVAWDLARASEGRFILGLGSQVRAHIERRFAMPWSGRPVAQLREYMTVVRAAWDAWQSGARPSIRGEHYRFTLMTPFFNPGPIDHPDIPVYLAGVGARMSQLAGEVADGLLVHPLHSVGYLADVIRPAMDAGAKRAGRDPANVRLGGSVLVATDDAELEATRQSIAFYASTPTYRPVLDHHGWGRVGEELSTLARQRRWDEMNRLVDDEMLGTFAIVGPWDTLGAELDARYGGMLERVSLYRSFRPGTEDDRWGRLVSSLNGQRAA
jgi:probable F420-dependent oxidoreductase